MGASFRGQKDEMLKQLLFGPSNTGVAQVRGVQGWCQLTWRLLPFLSFALVLILDRSQILDRLVFTLAASFVCIQSLLLVIISIR